MIKQPKEPTLVQLGLTFILGCGIFATSKILNGGTGFFNSLWPALVSLPVMTFYWIQLQASMHAQYFEESRYLDHRSRARWKPLLFMVLIPVVPSLIIHAYYFHWNKIALLSLYGLSWFAIVFTVSLNLKRGLPAFYVSKDPKSSLPDRLFSRLPQGGFLQVLFYLFLCVLFGYIYLIGYLYLKCSV